jgi:hypothetical protein
LGNFSQFKLAAGGDRDIVCVQEPLLGHNSSFWRARNSI